RTALANDPVAAVHYAGFDAGKARVVRLSEPEKAYVSYRIGNRIYWTKHELSLAKGETIITDGVHYARTRCGNRLSETPMQPVARLDPQPAELEAPLQAPSSSVADVPFVLPMIAAPDSALTQAAPEFAAIAPALIFPVGSYFVPPIFPSNGGSPGKPGKPPTIPPSPPIGPPPPLGPPPPPPIVPTPEPSSVLLLLAGLASLALLPRKRRA
ncbi:MAG: PEP-CTERM sorting domain-containing protein, partial [Blastocatellia bacterium]